MMRSSDRCGTGWNFHISGLLLAAAVIGGAVFFTGTVFADEGIAPVPEGSLIPALEHEFIGAKRCAICHRTEKQGQQHPIWLESAHAKAFDTLLSEEAQRIGQERGIENPSASGACLKCHSTAYWYSETIATNAVPVSEGVSCESCHGPGKDYMNMNVMRSRELSVAHGLLIPDAQSCLLCHNAESPTAKPFNFEEAWEQIKHPVP